MIKTYMLPNKLLFRVMIAFITFWFVEVVVTAKEDLQMGITLNVVTHYQSLVNYKNYQLANHDQFISGMQGKPHWYPRNLLQALILNTASGSGIDIFHLLLFICFAAMIYYIISDANKPLFFSNKTNASFKSLAYMIIISGFLEFLKSLGLKYYLNHITNGQFELPLTDFPWLYYYLLGSLFVFLQKIPQKALELQEEQALTI